jgi:spore coat protein SA
VRIGFVAQPFDRLCPPVQGGSLAIWIYQVATRCTRRGHQAFVFANHGGALNPRSVRSEEVDYVYTPTGLNRLTNRLNRLVIRFKPRVPGRSPALPEFASAWGDIVYAWEAARRVRQRGCDAVHIFNYSQFVPVFRRLNPGARICLHMHCEWLTQLDRRAVERRLEQADLIIGCSEYITEKIAVRFPQFKSRCLTVPNAAPLVDDHKSPSPEPGRVLFVGRVSPEKGVHDLIVAFHEVLKCFPEARLSIVGGAGSAPFEYMVGLSDDPHVRALGVYYRPKEPGGDDPYWMHLQEAAGPELGKRIFFEGRVDYGRTEAFYNRAAVLVNPSLSESFGMSLVEAMMHHVPVVATRVGGMQHIVEHGRTGQLVEPGNPSALAKALCEVLGDREKARRMGEAGRQRAVERFSWERTTDLLLESFQTLLH